MVKHYGKHVCWQVNADQDMDYVESEVIQLIALPRAQKADYKVGCGLLSYIDDPWPRKK